MTSPLPLERYIFPFNDQGPLAYQDDNLCTLLWKDFWQFIESRSVSYNFSEIVAEKNQYFRIEWIARYGCAVIFRPSGSTSVETLVVGLDEWAMRVHSDPEKRTQTAVPDVRKAAVFFHTVPIAKDKLNELWGNFISRLHGSEGKNTGKSRGQYQGHRGNQKTPSFVNALLLESINELRQGNLKKESSHGGTTDVGRHTDCLPRNTCFPLVLSVLHTIVVVQNYDARRSNDFNKCVAVYLTGFIDRMADFPTVYEARAIDRVMAVIREADDFILRVEDEDFKENLTKDLSWHFKALCDLPMNSPQKPCCVESESVEQAIKSLRSPKYPQVPQVPDSLTASELLERFRADAKANLCWTNVKSAAYTGKEQDCWLQANSYNEKFWEISKRLDDKKESFDIPAYRKMLDEYSSVADVIVKATEGSAMLMTVVLKSYKTLAWWIVFCASHQMAERSFPVFMQYGTALLAEDLQYLVLENRKAIEASRRVSTFLRKRNNPQKPFRDPHSTLSLAAAVKGTLPHLSAIYEVELSLAEKHIEARWVEVQKKQQELRILDKKLLQAHDLERERRVAMENAEQCWTYSDYNPVQKTAYQNAQRLWNEASDSVRRLESSIRSLEKKPANPQFALPRTKSTALDWLFIIFLPQQFRDICKLAHRCESLLRSKAPKGKEEELDLIKWYVSRKKHQHDSISVGVSFVHGLFTRDQAPRIDTPNIRHFSRETGVFFPDSFNLDPGWRKADPFKEFNVEESTLLYSEILPTGSRNLQNFIPMLPRNVGENIGVASVQERPKWMPPSQYLVFTKLRSHRRSQFRSLVDTIALDRLPFDNHCIHILVKQLMYQIGEESWTTDIKVQFNGLVVLAFHMRNKLEVLRETPMNWERLQLYGVICAFYGQYDVECLRCATEYCDALKHLGDNVNAEKKSLSEASIDLIRKQGELYGSALLCHSVGDRSEQQLKTLLKLSILLKNCLLCEQSAASSSGISAQDFKSKLQPFEQVMVAILAQRYHEVNKFILNYSNTLTECLLLIVEDAPSRLTWNPVVFENAQETACFEAVHSETLYSINILNGNVLVNGCPPGLLPGFITKDPLYVRTFGETNFKVMVLGHRKFRTVKSLENNCFYKFEMDLDEKLLITEINTTLIEELILLHRNDLDLPVRLKQMHSHWMDKGKGIVLLRGPSYQNRLVTYFMLSTKTFIVPPGQECITNALLSAKDNFSCLLRGSNKFSTILSRFESEEYIHISVDPGGSKLQYSIERYSLIFEQIFEQNKMTNRCIHFDGYSLASDQSFQDTLPGLSQLLILQNNDFIKVIVPECEVSAKSQLVVPTSFNQKLDYITYNEHPRLKVLQAADTIGRLQLAAIYASNASSLQDKRHGKCGFAIAIDLLRQCWRNEPFSEREAMKLNEVCAHSQVCCSLRVMCSYIFMHSRSLEFVHQANRETTCLMPDSLAAIEYRQKAMGGWMSNSTPRLHPFDEMNIFGMRQLKHLSHSVVARGSSIETFAKNVELMLSQIPTIIRIDGEGENRNFPLEKQSDEDKIVSELEESYKLYMERPRYSVPITDEFIPKAKHILKNTSDRRVEVERAIMNQLTPTTVSERLFVYGGRVATPNRRDLLILLSDSASLFPQIGGKDLSCLICEIIDWAILCVLEDKLQRILELDPTKDELLLLDELQCVREWTPTSHPRWLAFEVEQQIQIRPDQYRTVQLLLKNPGTMVQLNMGKGKTRVLVPMLVLEWATKAQSLTTRLNVLPAIIHETVAYFRNVLMASTQYIRIYTLPFHRRIPLDKSNSDVIADEIVRCCEDPSGIMVVAPQHRNSLLLKVHEADVDVNRLKLRMRDVLDESDAILHHEFQLVYALGTQIPLPDGPSRWKSIEALLKITSSVLAETYHGLIHWELVKPGFFPKLRLLQPFFDETKNHIQDLSIKLSKHLIANPPYEFRWMKNVGERYEAHLIELFSAPEADASLSNIACITTVAKNIQSVLAVRGCIAYGVLFHALSARHRVNYGLNEKSGRLIAVPFAATDTPKGNSEFSHPDMAIAYTVLSYFHTGLTMDQFECALRLLLEQGPTARQMIYQDWISDVRLGLEHEVLVSFDDVSKIDLSNKIQISLMHGCLGKAMEVISYWMNNFVFPSETYQFPSKRATSAHSLVDENSIGFSGTDDTRFLLPLAVKQSQPATDSLRGTNGQMIDLILKHTNPKIHHLDDVEKELWGVVLDTCIALEADALIDVGGKWLVLVASKSSERWWRS